MSILRNNPDVGYFDDDFLKGAGVSQNVRANGFVHLSGVVAGHGQGDVLFPNDTRAQTEYVIEMIGKLLAAEGLGLADLVSLTVYTPDMPALVENANLFATAFAEHPPCSTWIGVATLAHPDLKLEVSAVAACSMEK